MNESDPEQRKVDAALERLEAAGIARELTAEEAASEERSLSPEEESESIRKRLEADPLASPMKPEDRLPEGVTQVTFLPKISKKPGGAQ
jgi:hypothetical protein